MSSRPDPLEKSEPPAKVPGWRQPWHTWRVLMFSGSLLLLGLALARAFMQGELPAWFEIVIQVAGYVLVAVGFFLAMRMRRESRDQLQKKGASPRGRG